MLTGKQRLFVEAYVGQARGNATEAARTAGYAGSEGTLAQVGYENLRKPEIRDAVDSLTRTIGEAPAGWYCRYGPSRHTRSLLVEHGGFSYDSDAYNDEWPYWTTVGGTPHLIVPYTQAHNDMKSILA